MWDNVSNDNITNHIHGFQIAFSNLILGSDYTSEFCLYRSKLAVQGRLHIIGKF